MLKVYTKNNCPKCEMVKNVLNSNEIEYATINVEEDASAFDYLVNTLQMRQLPVIEPEEGEIFSGFDPDKLNGLINK
ncbi:glutaredoxin family protein [Cytobacillus kochii]|uniref:glutaredoxin family protein n=1 Tax=Cytobacillus kochii TaxID=859143 RepID=UPI001CD7FF47|nr:glutaredoxin family protein [Cytobacillus kochii]MCA1027063.1 glutaredoxin family protein [Cytobacillus kochii]